MKFLTLECTNHILFLTINIAVLVLSANCNLVILSLLEISNAFSFQDFS